MRIFVAGATGYIGRFVAQELVGRGHEVVCLARPRAGVGGVQDAAATRAALPGAEVRFGDVTKRTSVRDEGFRGERFDAVVSCLGSRTGAVADARNVELAANLHLLDAALEVGASHFVLLSALCVQKPRLAFQRAKAEFEASLRAAPIAHSIVRPTAFFKSLAGQVEKVREGAPFTVFGDGTLTACKPISEADLAAFVADCLVDADKRDRTLPIGGPGPAITPVDQAAMLGALLGREVKLRKVPVALLDGIIAFLDVAGAVAPPLRDKAELARIGRYYGTESMLVWDGDRYDADATPSTGRETLQEFYARVLEEGLAGQELGDHAVFGGGG
jgi:divinyl chlorophyllide a 8-vinyl-reductase